MTDPRPYHDTDDWRRGVCEEWGLPLPWYLRPPEPLPVTRQQVLDSYLPGNEAKLEELRKVLGAQTIDDALDVALSVCAQAKKSRDHGLARGRRTPGKP